MHCLICGTELNTCVCPRCSFDQSLCRELYPTLDVDECKLSPLFVYRNSLYRKSEDTAAALTCSEEECRSVSADLEAQKATNDELSAKQESLRRDFEAAQAERDNLQQSYEALSAERDNLRRDYEDVNDKWNTLRQKFETAASERNALRQDLRTVNAERDKLRKELESVNAERDKLRKELESVTAECDNLRRNTPVSPESPAFPKLFPKSPTTVGIWQVQIKRGQCTILGSTIPLSGSVIIPHHLANSSVVAIADSAFEGSDLTSLSIPNTVTRIGKAAFRNCKQLIVVSLFYGTAIEAEAFSGCRKLLRVNYPSVSDEHSNKDNIDPSAFLGAAPNLVIAAAPGSAPLRFAAKQCYHTSTQTIDNLFVQPSDLL